MKKIKAIAAVACSAIMISCFCSCTEAEGSAANQVSSEPQPETVTAETTVDTEQRPVSASWFDDAVFVGDSVTLKLSYYCDTHPEALGDAKFFCAGSLGYTNALWDLYAEGNVHPYYQGQNYQAQSCAEVTGASKVFVMLGMNDIGLYGIDESLENAKTLIDNILETTPNIRMYVQSVTPIIMGKEGEALNNANIRAFDKKLEAYAEEKGFGYLDIYGLLADKDGYLPLEYCGDQDAQGIHFTDAACEKWADYLKENV